MDDEEDKNDDEDENMVKEWAKSKDDKYEEKQTIMKEEEGDYRKEK